MGSALIEWIEDGWWLWSLKQKRCSFFPFMFFFLLLFISPYLLLCLSILPLALLPSTNSIHYKAPSVPTSITHTQAGNNKRPLNLKLCCFLNFFFFYGFVVRGNSSGHGDKEIVTIVSAVMLERPLKCCLHFLTYLLLLLSHTDAGSWKGKDKLIAAAQCIFI